MSDVTQPTPGIVEIRVHGVGGTSPAAMLGRSDLVQVSGDDISGFYRSPNQEHGRTTEAYSWGGLTARVATRALWVLLLPFSLVNIAGWMIEPVRHREQPPSHGLFRWLDRLAGWLGSALPESTSKWLAGVQGWLVHLLGLAFTATYVQLAAFVTVDLLAYQCGSNEVCRARLPLSGLLGGPTELGRKLVIGVALPIGLLVLFLFLARRSRLMYEAYRPTADQSPKGTGVVSALEDPLVWDRVGFQKVAARFHSCAAIGGLLITLCGTALQLEPDRSTAAIFMEQAGLWFGVGLVVLSATMVLWMAVYPARAESAGHKNGETSIAGNKTDANTTRSNLWNLVTRVCFWSAWGILATELIVVWNLRPRQEEEALTWFALAPLLLLTAAIVIGALLAMFQAIRWVAERYLQTDQFLVPMAALAVALFPRPLVLVIVAVVLLGLNIAVAPTDGRSAARIDLVLIGAVALVGWGVSAVLREPGYLWAGLAVTVGAAAFIWLARRPDEGFRWAGTGAVAAFAAIVLLGIFSGVIVRLASWLASDDFSPRYPGFYRWSVVAVAMTLLVALFGLLLFSLRVRLINRKQWHDDIMDRLPGAGIPGNSDARHQAARKAVRFRWLSESVQAVDVMITMAGMILFAAGLSGAWKMGQQGIELLDWFDRPFPQQWSWLVDRAAWLAVAAVVAAYFVVRSGLRNEATRRRIGVVWDVASFFPRMYHPLAPPAYAARAVPEIQARIRETVDQGGRVILAGHSQGSVIAAAVLASLPDHVTRRTALVTYGSPIGRFYRRYFPEAFDSGLVKRLAVKVGPGSTPDGPLCWINFYRLTDPIGSRAFLGDEPAPLAFRSELVNSLGTRGRSAVGGDVCLDDPWETELTLYRPYPKVRLHSSYESDPAWLDIMQIIGQDL